MNAELPTRMEINGATYIRSDAVHTELKMVTLFGWTMNQIAEAIRHYRETTGKHFPPTKE